MSRLRNVGYMLICRLRTYRRPDAPLAEGNFVRGKLQGLGLYFGMISLTRAHTRVHKHMHKRTRPFNAATQWGSVSNAALVFFFFFKQGNSERFVGTQPLFSHSPSCKNNL